MKRRPRNEDEAAEYTDRTEECHECDGCGVSVTSGEPCFVCEGWGKIRPQAIAGEEE